MRKQLILALILMTGLSLGAVSVDLGLSYGGQQLNDDKLEPIFGNGKIFCPELSVNVFKGLTLGILYEGGYDKDGDIGTIEVYASNLNLSGLEGFIGYTLDLGRFHPFVRVGIGSHKYEQTYAPKDDAKELPDNLSSFEKSKSVFSFGGGLKIDLIAGLYLGGQIRYLPMKFTLDVPGNNSIDLDMGGMRYMVTVGYRFDFAKKK